MMEKSAIFGALWAAWGAPTCGWVRRNRFRLL